MKFWFLTHPTRPEANALKALAQHIILNAGGICVPDAGDADFLVAIGGDGTVVAAHRASKKPIIGVNAGTLGYLPRIEPDELESALNSVFVGDYALEKRMTISGSVDGGDEFGALNDIALIKPDAGIIRFSVIVDGVQLMRYTADGIIAATPTGSTGYSLSAGGPIVDPSGEVIVLTPIAPHTLVNRSIVLSSESIITLAPESDALIAVDGDVLPISAGSICRVTRAENSVCFVSLKRESFIGRLRRKLV